MARTVMISLRTRGQLSLTAVSSPFSGEVLLVTFTFLRRWLPATFATSHWEVHFLDFWFFAVACPLDILPRRLRLGSAVPVLVLASSMIYPFRLEANRQNSTLALSAI